MTSFEKKDHIDMALKRTDIRLTVEEYLAFERASEERHIWIDGTIFDMAGESPAHADITSNSLGELNTQLRGTPCRAWTKDTKVRSGAGERTSRKGMFSYPDIVVIRGDPQFHDEHQDIVTNPRVIIEVLSETTQMFDRTLKFYRYRTWNSTLTDYILISQDQAAVEHFPRQDDESWVSRFYTGLDAVVPLPVFDVKLALRIIYDRVSFPNDEATG